MKKANRAAGLIAAVLCLMVTVGTVGAQSADPALVSAAVTAFQQTLASTSLHVESQTITERGGNQQGSTASYDLVQGASGWNVSGSQTTSITIQENTMEATTSVVILDGTVYMLVEGGMATFAPPGGDGAAGGTGGGAVLSEGWYVASTPDAVNEGTTPQMGGQSAESQISRALGLIGLPMTPDAITAISELAGDTIDGQAMRVIQISLDPQTLIDSGAAALLNAGGGFGGGFGTGTRPTGEGIGMVSPDGNGAVPPRGEGGAPPAEGQPLTPPNGGDATGPQRGQGGGQFAQISAENTQITFAIYVGADDGLVHRIYSVIALGGAAENPQGATTITTVVDYSAFGEPVEITAPV